MKYEGRNVNHLKFRHSIQVDCPDDSEWIFKLFIRPKWDIENNTRLKKKKIKSINTIHHFQLVYDMDEPYIVCIQCRLQTMSEAVAEACTENYSHMFQVPNEIHLFIKINSFNKD